MKNKLLVVLFVFGIVLSSCNTDSDAYIKIYNDCTDDVDITQVYVKEENDLLYREFSGVIKPGESYELTVEPSKYFVGIVTRDNTKFLFQTDYKLKHTGTSNLKEVHCGGTLKVRFDGKGVYWD